MAHPLFKLRGKLPTQTRIILEIAGILLVVLIWYIIAGLGSTEQESFPTEELTVYHNNVGENAILKNPYVLVYDQSNFKKEDVLQLSKDAAEEGRPILLLTGQADSPSVSALVNEVEGLQIVAAKAPLSQKDAIFERAANFSGSTIVNQDFLESGEAFELTTNFLGRSDNVLLENGTLSLKNRTSWISDSLLPSPVEVLKSFGELFNRDNLVFHAGYSVILNLMGYLIAIGIALPIGFVIGLFPLFRGLFNRQVDALRFLPLTAVTGLFIAWFGIEVGMKVSFLAFGIIVYLLPVVVQRIDEVDRVYLQTAYTLGATQWQKIKTVFIPAVLSKISDDVRVLVAISWTYIIVAELVNNTGGIGGLIWRAGQRQGRYDKVFALLLIIILVGFIQDRLFLFLDRVFFPHKYQTK